MENIVNSFIAHAMKKNPSRNVHLKKGPSKLLETINSSIVVDQRMYKEDIEGSIAHAKMLGKQKIISKKVKKDSKILKKANFKLF